MKTHPHLTGIEIAIVGMDCQFPGANTPEDFWQNLAMGKESITFLTDEQMLQAGIGPDIFSLGRYVNASGILENFNKFDREFFGYSKRDSQILNPTHRLLLSCCYSALENAGYASDMCGKNTGIYAALSQNNYLKENLLDNKSSNEVDIYRLQMLNSCDQLAALVAYNLNLQGPAVTIQAACASSLVVVHMACQGLLAGDCRIALAGAVTCRVPHYSGYEYFPGMNLSKDGNCYSFDTQTTGTVPGSGVGTLVLKRLEDAITDQDFIYGIIKSTALNNDGKSKMNYTSPNAVAQKEVIQKALHLANIGAHDISYIEGHGSGTKIGDEIELTVLKDIFDRERKYPCWLGAVKANVGHLDAAAGMAGLFKTVLMLKHKKIPPQINYLHNPLLANSQIKIASTLQDWELDDAIRMAGISSMGIGGTNVHVILMEAFPNKTGIVKTNKTPAVLPFLCLSAKTTSVLAKMKLNLESYLTLNSHVTLSHITHTLLTGRNIYHHQSIFIKPDLAAAHLERILDNKNTLTKDNPDLHIHFCDHCSPAFITVTKNIYRNDFDFKNILDSIIILLDEDIQFKLKSFVSGQAEYLENNMAELAGVLFQYALVKLCLIKKINISSFTAEGSAGVIALHLAGCISTEIFLQMLLISKMNFTLPCKSNLVTISPPQIALKFALPNTNLTMKKFVAYLESKQPAIPSISTTDVNFKVGNWYYSIINSPAEYHLPKCDFVKLGEQHEIDSNWLFAQLWLYKIRINNAAADSYTRVALPVYPFDAQVCWENPAMVTEHQLIKSSPKEKSLRNIWEELLGQNTFCDQDNFYDIGGDSLLAAQLVAHINTIFGINLDHFWIENYQTLASQNKYLDQAHVPQILSNKLITKLNDANENAIKVFLIHPGMGDGKVYQNLAMQFDSNIQIYGVDSSNKNSVYFTKTMEDLGNLYLSHIREIQPQGPYYLGGWSLGGTIAYEIAQQLSAKGENVSKLYLLDSYLFDLHGISLYEKVKHLFYRLHLILNNKHDASYDDKIGLYHLLKVEIDLLKHYSYKKYSGFCILFHAEKGFELPIEKSIREEIILTELNSHLASLDKNGWGGLIPQLKVKNLPVDHNHVLSKSAMAIIKNVIENDILELA
jgi:3-oxoacyl-(acyl-carrier-protein) synthase/thioesterase domain-containing protein